MSSCLLFGLLVCSRGGRAQTPEATPPKGQQDQGEVLRTYTELVQTDVMVFDKQGRFANGLTSADFELRIDGKPKPIEFFEKVIAGSVNEETQLAAARGSPSRSDASRASAPAPLDRGRPVFFYVDDLHLELSGLQLTRKLITHFIEDEMGQNDEAAIASASGQIGFLQQLTDNRNVLLAALDRIKVRSTLIKDYDRPTMTVYQAELIASNDRDTTDYFIAATMRIMPGLSVTTAESLVTARARALVKQTENSTANTLIGLEGLVRAADTLPGRKLVFFISGGFLLGDSSSDSRHRLQRITDAAARSGVVIYSMDARGLVGTLLDASTGDGFDPTGVLSRSTSGELLASQDGLNALAKDTGGRTVFNTNSLDAGLSRAMRETSTYYLLAWKPDPETRHTSKFRRIEVKIVGRPDLTVQVRRGFFDREPEPVETAKTTKRDQAKKDREAANSPEAQLRKALLAPYPRRDLPVSMNLSYVNIPPKGARLSTVLQVPHEVLTFAPLDGKQVAHVLITGTVLDDKGNAGASFSNRLTIEAPSIEAAREAPDPTYGYPIYLKPGLYQVRVGARDEQSGRSGTAHGWIEIPNIAAGKLALSSLMMGLRTRPAISNASANANVPDAVDLSITHQFAPNGYLRFLLMVYNAARATTDGKPDLAVQVQIVRDRQPVITTPLRKITLDDIVDFASIPYAAELSLNGIPPGRYLLHVTVVDRVSKQSATQQTRFEIE
ncbi:MAG TPA: VWA domain-containing protein [Pyrinomonadaceae bacterium]